MKKIFVMTLLLFGFIIQSKSQSAEKIVYEVKEGKVQKVKETTIKEIISENISTPPGFTAEEVVVALNEGKNLIRYGPSQIENTFPFYTISSDKHEYRWNAKNGDWVFLGLSSRIDSSPKVTGFFLGLFLLIVTVLMGYCGGVFYWVLMSESLISKLDTRANAVFSVILVTIVVSGLFLLAPFLRNEIYYLDFFVSTYYTWISLWVLDFIFSFGVIFSLNREDKKEKFRNEKINKDLDMLIT